ncbi:MAG: DUF4256 domain-containing protein [Candidatus Gracilibacteria bacterium]
MELNQLPGGYEGQQKRRTEFESVEEKLAFDAQNLIALAKRSLERTDGIKIPSKGKILDAVTTIIGAHRNDYNEELMNAVISRCVVDEQAQTSTTEAAQLAESSPEQAWLGEFKTRFDALSVLHPNVEWEEVKKSLQADPESMRKLQALDAAGFEMNVFRAKNDSEIQFRTAQADVSEIAAAYRTIMYDKKAQTDYPDYNVNGNAEDIAASMGVELADGELYEQLRVRSGWVWLKTDPVSREAGRAFYGDSGGIGRDGARYHSDDGSFCAALRVKKV